MAQLELAPDGAHSRFTCIGVEQEKQAIEVRRLNFKIFPDVVESSDIITKLRMLMHTLKLRVHVNNR